MSLWSKQKHEELLSDEDWPGYESEEFEADRETSLSSLAGITKLTDKPATMPGKKICYEIRDKPIPGSRKKFTALVQVPPGKDSGPIFENLSGYFDGQKSNMRGLETDEKVEEAWNTLNEAYNDNIIKKENMLEVCKDRLTNRQHFTPQEVRDALKTLKKSPPKPQPTPGSPASSSGSGAPSKGVTQTNPPPAQLHPVGLMGAPAAAREEVIQTEESFVGDDQKDVLAFSFYDENGDEGQQYILNEETEAMMKQVLSNNPQTEPAQFFLKCGIDLIPMLMKENRSLQDRVIRQDLTIENLRTSLKEVSSDRDKRVGECMHRGSTEINAVGEAKRGLVAAKAKVEELEKQVEDLKEITKNLDGLQLGGIAEKLEKIEKLSTGTQMAVGKIDVTTNRIVQIMGNDKNKVGKMFTPVGQKLATIEGEWVVVAQAKWFKAASKYRSLSQDFEKIVKSGMIEKVVVSGEGMGMARDLEGKKLSPGTWDGKFVIIIVDDAEKIEDKVGSRFYEGNLESVAKMISMIVEEDKPKQVMVVSGPTTDQEVVGPRKTVCDKLGELLPKSAKINMNDMAEKMGGQNILEKWCDSGRWSPLATAHLLSAVTWLVEDFEGRLGQEISPAICAECGTLHEGKEKCLKGELEIREHKGDDVTEIERVESSSRQKNGGRRGEQQFQQQNNNTPTCHVCGKPHTGYCRTLLQRSRGGGASSRGGGGGTARGGGTKRPRSEERGDIDG